MKKAYDYFLGNYRYLLLDSYFEFLIREHILQQYYRRLSLMDKECYNNGSCSKCGCTTPNLQMASKACEGACYPPFLTKKQWKES